MQELTKLEIMYTNWLKLLDGMAQQQQFSGLG